MIVAAVVALALASADECSPWEPCVGELTCDLSIRRCVHTPRQLGEPCDALAACADTEPGTTHELECSSSCGACVPKGSSTGLPPKPDVDHSTSRYGVTGRRTFANFEASVVTSMPVMYPKHDSELAALLTTIQAHGCKARPVGATHTSAPFVTTADESATVGISLAEYTPSDNAWDRVTLDTATSRARGPGGATLFDLYAVVRPERYFLPTQTAGALFTLAGLVANHVHGGVYGRGYIYEHVTALRVATFEANHTVRFNVLRGAALRAWRGSYGLLGVITGVELQLEKRPRFATFTRWHVLPSFTRESVEDYFQQLEQDSMYSENFLNLHQGEGEIFSVAWHRPEHIPSECDDVTDADCTWDYWGFDCRNPLCCSYQFQLGDMMPQCRVRYPNPTRSEMKGYYSAAAPLFENVKYNGAISGWRESFCTLDRINTYAVDVVGLLVAMGFRAMTNAAQLNAEEMNDGFVLRESSSGQRVTSYAVPVENAFEFIRSVRGVYADLKRQTGESVLGQFECRFLQISDVSTLNPTEAQTGAAPSGSKYLACEPILIAHTAQQNAWREPLIRVEQHARALNGVVHTGKMFCFGYDDKGVAHPYLDKRCMKSIFNQQQKQEFLRHRQQYDPLNLFAGGVALEFFQ